MGKDTNRNVRPTLTISNRIVYSYETEGQTPDVVDKFNVLNLSVDWTLRKKMLARHTYIMVDNYSLASEADMFLWHIVQ